MHVNIFFTYLPVCFYNRKKGENLYICVMVPPHQQVSVYSPRPQLYGKINKNNNGGLLEVLGRLSMSLVVSSAANTVT